MDELRMSRARLYVLIDSFEADLRSMIERYLLDHLEEHHVFVPNEIEQISKRRGAEAESESASAVHYLDLQVAADVLLRHKTLLPNELTNEFERELGDLPRLTPIRHRVMHGRPLLDSDPQAALQMVAGLASRHWPSTKKVMKSLQGDPAWEPLVSARAVPYERTIHNLPEVDYDETSFIGRRDDRKKLIDMLRKRRNPVITLTGEGGIGKTAMALDVAYQLLDSDDNPYDAILWVSLKTEKLTAYGVEELKDAIRGIDRTIVELGKGLAADFNGSLAELAEALEGIETLVVIDNLESAHGEEIVEMYDALPASVSFLFTSRWGIGQLERTFPIVPLDKTDAMLLLRRFASARNQKSLASLSPQAAENTTKNLRYSPLAIRWFVLASEAGRVPLQVLRDQSELLRFCVENVVNNLSDDSRAVLNVLRSLDRSISFDEFAVLTEMTIDSLRRATQELTRGSLVLVEAEAVGAIAGRLALTATARLYLPQPDLASEFIATVTRRERAFRTSLEDVNGKGRGFKRVVPRDSQDYSAVYMLNSALNFERSGNFDKAHYQVERARSFNPEFSEVYRVLARLKSAQGQHEGAVAELRNALSYAADDPARARAHYDLADITSRCLHDAAQALPHAASAYELENCADTAYLRGKLLVWTGDHASADDYLQEALDLGSKKLRRFITTTMTDNWGRWANSDRAEDEMESSVSKATTGFHLGRKLLEENPIDSKLVDVTAECVIQALRAMNALNDAAITRHASSFRNMAQFAARKTALMGASKRRILKDAFVSARFVPALGGETITVMESARASLRQASSRAAGPRPSSEGTAA